MENITGSNITAPEMFITSFLQEDLKFAYENREKLKLQLIEFDELKQTINIFKTSELQTNGLQSALNIGCDFFVDATVKDVSKIFLNLGAGVFFECTLDEALPFIASKQKLLEHQIEYMTCKIAEIEGFIALYKSSLSISGDSSGQEFDFSFVDQIPLASEPTKTSSHSAIEAAQNVLLNILKSS